MRIFFYFSIIFSVAFGQFEPKCMVDETFQETIRPIPWITVDLSLKASERFGVAYEPFGEKIHRLVGLVRESLMAIAPLPVSFLEEFVGFALEDAIPNKYLEEISGIAKIANISLEDAVMLNVFYEMSRYCTSIIAEDPHGRLVHGRNLDFGQFLGGWNHSTHEWRLTEALREASVNLRFVRNGSLIFVGTTFAGHVGLLSGWSPLSFGRLGMKPHSFTLTLNARLKSNFKNFFRWLAHSLRPQPHLVLWVEREVLERATSFVEAKRFLSRVPQLADCYYILGGKHSEEAVIIVRNRTSVVDQRFLRADQFFLLHTNYDFDEPSFYLDDRQRPGEKCMGKLNPQRVSVSSILKVLSSKPTKNKTTVHSVVMSIHTNTYQSFVQKCPDPCWFI